MYRSSWRESAVRSKSLYETRCACTSREESRGKRITIYKARRSREKNHNIPSKACITIGQTSIHMLHYTCSITHDRSHMIDCTCSITHARLHMHLHLGWPKGKRSVLRPYNRARTKHARNRLRNVGNHFDRYMPWISTSCIALIGCIYFYVTGVTPHDESWTVSSQSTFRNILHVRRDDEGRGDRWKERRWLKRGNRWKEKVTNHDDGSEYQGEQEGDLLSFFWRSAASIKSGSFSSGAIAAADVWATR